MRSVILILILCCHLIVPSYGEDVNANEQKSIDSLSSNVDIEVVEARAGDHIFRIGARTELTSSDDGNEPRTRTTISYKLILTRNETEEVLFDHESISVSDQQSKVSVRIVGMSVVAADTVVAVTVINDHVSIWKWSKCKDVGQWVMEAEILFQETPSRSAMNVYKVLQASAIIDEQGFIIVRMTCTMRAEDEAQTCLTYRFDPTAPARCRWRPNRHTERKLGPLIFPEDDPRPPFD